MSNNSSNRQAVISSVFWSLLTLIVGGIAINLASSLLENLLKEQLVNNYYPLVYGLLFLVAIAIGVQSFSASPPVKSEESTRKILLPENIFGVYCPTIDIEKYQIDNKSCQTFTLPFLEGIDNSILSNFTESNPSLSASHLIMGEPGVGKTWYILWWLQEKQYIGNDAQSPVFFVYERLSKRTRAGINARLLGDFIQSIDRQVQGNLLNETAMSLANPIREWEDWKHYIKPNVKLLVILDLDVIPGGNRDHLLDEIRQSDRRVQFADIKLQCDELIQELSDRVVLFILTRETVSYPGFRPIIIKGLAQDEFHELHGGNLGIRQAFIGLKHSGWLWSLRLSFARFFPLFAKKVYQALNDHTKGTNTQGIRYLADIASRAHSGAEQNNEKYILCQLVQNGKLGVISDNYPLKAAFDNLWSRWVITSDEICSQLLKIYIQDHINDFCPSSPPAKSESSEVAPESNNLPTINKETKMPVDIVILTVLPQEYDAVYDQLGNVKPYRRNMPNPYTWVIGEIPCNGGGSFSVALGKTGQAGTSHGALATNEAVTTFSPQYLLFVGIAGGFNLNGLTTGDVVIGTEIYGYEYAKIDKDNTFIFRHDWVYRPDLALMNGAIAFSTRSKWAENIQPNNPLGRTPKAIPGQIASGDKVIDDPTNEFFAAVLRNWPNKLQAVEMEGAGAATAIELAQAKKFTTGFLMIRGISDMPAGQDVEKEQRGTQERDSWKSYASAAAAAFVTSFIASDFFPIRPRQPASK